MKASLHLEWCVLWFVVSSSCGCHENKGHKEVMREVKIVIHTNCWSEKGICERKNNTRLALNDICIATPSLSTVSNFVEPFVYRLVAYNHPSIHIHLGWSAVRVPFYGVGSTRLCWTLALHASLSSGSTPARQHLLTSVFTHSDHVFWGPSLFLVPRIWKFVIDLIPAVGHCTWPCHLSRRLWRSNVSSLMSNCYNR